MLKIDGRGLSERQVQQLIKQTCLRYGMVKQVEICTDPLSARAFALVYMACDSEARQVASALGGKMLGASVILDLPATQPQV